MNSVDKDVLMSGKIITKQKSFSIYDLGFSDYSMIYPSSNELLNSIFSLVDVKDKDVLTVLASGDQRFHLLSRGAQSVDLFDINKLTIHYYYLREWSIRYLGIYYICDNRFDFINSLLKIVKPKTEEEQLSYNYWLQVINLFKKDIDLLFFDEYPMSNKIKDISSLNKVLDKSEVNFYNVDISNPVEINKKYDIVYVSNIQDYIPRDVHNFVIYEENLKRLLKDKGVVVSANVRYFGPCDEESIVFKPDFKYHDLGNIVGYTYTRR